MTPVIIAIDDDPCHLTLLEKFLTAATYDVVCFSEATDAMNYLATGGAADAILLDRMMPGMDGIAFMQQARAMAGQELLPIIMQTASATTTAIAEGIAAGANYYLIKPFDRDLLIALVSRALTDHEAHHGLHQMATQMTAAMGKLEQIQLSFKTLDDVRDVSYLLASLSPDPSTILLGITELMMNALEHGNLGITYSEKCELNRSGGWREEVERRLALPENRDKVSRVWFKRDAAGLMLTIEDMGPGFDWTPYVVFDRQRVQHSHGRGIAMSRMVSFDEVTYVAPGNKVICRKRFQPHS